MFMAEFMMSHGTGVEGWNEEDEEDGTGEERRKERMKKMYKGAEKAAGGNLAEVRDWVA